MSQVARLLFPALAVAAACRSVETPYRYPEDLDHPSYVKRARAVSDFAARRDADEIGRAFPLLRDEDAGIRTVAWLALRSLMPGNEDMGYLPYLPDDIRAGIAERWEAWWRKGGDSAPVAGAEGCGGAVDG